MSRISVLKNPRLGAGFFVVTQGAGEGLALFFFFDKLGVLLLYGGGIVPMYKNAGFTLIELLVVVLIIGILAAAALPQYQKAVAKSRLMGYLQLVQGIRRAQEVYYLANNTYTRDVADLDVDFSDICPHINVSDKGMFQCPFAFIDTITSGEVTPASSAVLIRFYSSGYTYGATATPDLSVTAYFAYSDHPGETVCVAYTKLGRSLCANIFAE